jgi:beta-1,4-N-acetylglucosaminyltransferase
MILVTVGTNGPSFDRLLKEVSALAGDEELVVQHGPSRVRPAGATHVDYFSFDELSRLVSDARIVVTHAGAGCLLLAMAHGHRPFMVPRRRRFGEAVDDHQVILAKRLDREDLGVYVDDPRTLCEAVRDAPRAGATPSLTASGGGSLARELGSYLRSVCEAA